MSHAGASADIMLQQQYASVALTCMHAAAAGMRGGMHRGVVADLMAVPPSGE